jgi:predicted amidohydrolase
MGRYTKIHPFRLGGEADQYQPGERPLVVEIDAGVSGMVRVAPLICYDLRFPETFREAALEGVDVFVVIANWPSKRQGHWQTLLRARAIENQAQVVGVNRTGSDPNLGYSGGSSIYDHSGQAVLVMDELPGIASAALNLAAQRQVREELPFLADFLERHRDPDVPRLLGSDVVLSE